MNSKVVVFDIKSKLAHFRKINSNSSSLTYIVPPRTTILGIIAGILGRERDSYYTDKDFEEMKIGVEPICPHRVMTQTINYLFVESFNDVTGYRNRTQVPVEFLTSRDDVAFRIYLSCNDNLLSEINECLKNEEYIYSISLGPAYCLADVNYVGEFDSICFDEQLEGFVDISTVIRMEDVIDYEFSSNLYKEKMPSKFLENRVCITNDYLFSKNNTGIKVKLEPKSLIILNLDGKEKLITYM
ncbi:type I-B CRISPR-associated protein Cas5b [Clostridium perfringens]